jgi:predicted membrane protein
MIIFTILGIMLSIFFFIVILMTIIETRIKNRRKEKLFWNMENLDKNRTYEEIQKGNDKKTQ